MKLAAAYSLAGSPEAAREAGRAADLLPDSVEAQLLAASLLLKDSSFFDAGERAAAVLRRDPDSIGALLIYGNAKARFWSNALALSSLDEAARQGGNVEGALRTLRAPVPSSDDQEAEATFVKAVRLAPTNPETQIALANFLWAAGRLDEGERPLRNWADGESDGFPSRILGDFYLSRGRVAEAETYLRRAVARGDREAPYVLADYLLKTGRKDEALAAVEPLKAIEDPTGYFTLHVADIEFRSGMTGQAMDRLDQQLTMRPNDARAASMKAQFLSASQDWAGALRFARVALTIEPKARQAQSTLGQALLATGEVEQAYTQLVEALRLDPDSTELPLYLSRASNATGRDREALTFGQEAVRKNPGNPDARLAFVKALVATADFAAADREIRPLLALAPVPPEVLVQLGTVQASRGNREAARSAFTRALQADAESFEAVSGLVALELKARNTAAARQHAERGLAAHPGDARYLLLSAGVRSAANDGAGAEQLYRQVLAADSANVTAAIALADALVLRQQGDAARQVIEQVLERRPRSLEARTALAGLLERQGRVDEARRQYEEILAENPGTAGAALRLATIYVDHGGNLDVALNLASLARRRLPDDPDTTDTLGWVYVAKQQTSQGLRYLREAVQAAPDNPVYRYHLGIAYQRFGDPKNADVELKRALQIDPNFRFAQEARSALASIR